MNNSDILLIMIQVLTGGIGIGGLFATFKALSSGTIRGSFKNKYRPESWNKDQNPLAFYFFVFCYLATSLLALSFLILTLLGVVDFKNGKASLL